MIVKLSKIGLAYFLSLSITWSIGFLVINTTQYLEQPTAIWFSGMLNNLIAAGFFTTIALPIYFIFHYLKMEKLVIHLLFSLLLFIEISSLFYYSITLEPISQSIFEFSTGQTAIILKSYFSFNWYYLLIPLPIAIYFFLLRYIRGENIIFYTLLILGLPLFFNFQLKVSTGSLSDLTINKGYYFIHSSLPFFKDNPTIFLNDKNIHFYQASTNSELKNNKYPLYRPSLTTNPLGPFFTLQEEKPNIQIIIVESLSSSFSGPRADEISYTPFLDSLAKHSLYFDNTLATAERSFAALPSILGSLPHGKSGFIHIRNGYPDNITLPKWLFHNGYTGSFHYGGDAHFDFMDDFMHNQKFKYIYGKKGFDYSGTNLQTSIDSIPFGIPDKLLFQQSMQQFLHRKNKPPYLDVFVTLSSHYPFMIPQHKKYYTEAKKIIEKAEISQEIKNKHLHYIPELSSFLYVDDALKYYFKQQEKTDTYQNTIYLIVGDHMMGDIPQNNPIEKYRSVLMIYSPLLKKHKVIRGVNSHLDICPSLYQLLQHKYDLPKIDSVAWLGQPFDTNSQFQSNRNVLFMRNNHEVEDLLHNNYFLSQRNLFKVENRLKIVPVSNKKKLDSLAKLLSISKLLHRDLVVQNKLIPPIQKGKMIIHKNKELIITQHEVFSNIIDYTLKDSANALLFNLKTRFFMDWNKTSKDSIPILVYHIKRQDTSLKWGTVDLLFNQFPIKAYRNLHFSVQSNLHFQLKKGDHILVYFWNYKPQKKKKFGVSIHPLWVQKR